MRITDHVKQTIPRLSFGSLLVIALSGCATTSPHSAFLDVKHEVEERVHKTVAWSPPVDVEPETQSYVQALLARPLTMESAVQIALLNNRDLRATYAELGIAQAELAQATRLRNPVIEGAITFAEGGATNLVFNAAFALIDALYIPIRARVAAAELEQVKRRVAGQVLDVAGQTSLAFVTYQARQEETGVLEQVIRARTASLDAAVAIREAGNIPQIEVETQRTPLIENQVELAEVRAEALDARERLNALMGLYGSDTIWSSADRLPPLPGQPGEFGNVETRAIAASLELSEARQRLIALGYSYRVTKAEALIPLLNVGVEAERDDGEWEAGPSFEATVPLFDWGKAKRARAKAEILRARDRFTGIAVRVRSQARALRVEALAAHDRAHYIQTVLLPQTARLIDVSQAQYNAMTLDIFRLLDAKRRQIEAGRRSIRALEAYWRAKARFSLLMAGKMTGESGAEAPAESRDSMTAVAAEGDDR